MVAPGAGPARTGSTVVVIGNFDGVHRGHRAVIEQARSWLSASPPGSGWTAGEPPNQLVAVTFWPHPMTVIRPGQAPLLLCDLTERRRLLLAAGCDDVDVVEFTADTATWSPAEFVERVLVPLSPAVVVVGENFRFGHRAEGTVATLAEIGRSSTTPFTVATIDLTGDEAGAVSSSRIRALVDEGDVRAAAELLGRPFRYTGVVCRGDQRGRELGYPTANIAVQPGFVVPTDGVYAGWVTRLDERSQPAGPRWPAAISVGTNPTFDGVQRRVESYVLDRTDLELYDETLAVDVVQRLRGQVKFTGIEALIEQMAADVDQTRTLLLG